ncbi:5'-nucleotidase, lipoprotein e(P4) family [Neobacillus drentensis]|uniref:5'-nucleotidase, lipoprotein e(P4) family n=1 Tax=Neobacillus drentensis TaxID=220684 RepID=UPI002FFD643F
MKKHFSIMMVGFMALSATVGYVVGSSKQNLTQVQAASAQQEKALETEGPTGDGLNNILTMAVAWKQTAAEYKALYHQSFNMARKQVDLALANHRPGDKPLAVITDLDDTVLSPVNYWGYLINNNIEFFDDAIWDKWIPTYNMVATPGSLDFLNYCKEKGVEVFYVSSRDQGSKTYHYAKTQLKKLNFPYVDDNHLTILRDTSNKETRQNEIAQNYDVISYLGDNLNDFRRVYYVKDVDERAKLMEQDKDLYGTKFILMPNPTDGHWVRAIFGESEPPATDENRAIWKDAATRSAWEQK